MRPQTEIRYNRESLNLAASTSDSTHFDHVAQHLKCLYPFSEYERYRSLSNSIVLRIVDPFQFIMIHVGTMFERMFRNCPWTDRSHHTLFAKHEEENSFRSLLF